MAEPHGDNPGPSRGTIALAPPEHRRLPAPRPVAPPAPPRVLVLDDEPSIRRLLARILRDGGFEPVLAADGPEAIRLCEDESFGALLVDHRMPGMSGIETYDAIMDARPELSGRVVFMSGDVLNPELGEFAKSRYIALVPKPFDMDGLIRVVGEVVHGQPAQRG